MEVARGASRHAVDFCLWQRDGSSLTALRTMSLLRKTQRKLPENLTQRLSPTCVCPLGQTRPLFVIGGYETLVHTAVTISHLPEHKSAAENYAAASNNVLPFITRWFGPPRRSARLAELPDSAAAPYENGGMLLTR